jgi:hypothetical protein
VLNAQLAISQSGTKSMKNELSRLAPLPHPQKSDRSHFLGGSDAKIIMAGDEAQGCAVL